MIEPSATVSNTLARPNHIFRRPTKSSWSRFGRMAPSAPMKRGFVNHLNPARRPSIARVAKTAVTIDITVPISRNSANPRTPAVAAANSTSAVIAVITFASTIVANPLPYPAAIAARRDLPARASSLIRSKMTTFASAATPIVRIIPAKPGSVSVTLNNRIAEKRKTP
jgi:hypothetical protein